MNNYRTTVNEELNLSGDEEEHLKHISGDGS
jgi:hypothetical protein